MLTDRRAQILSLIIQDYVETAEPVGSAALARRHAIRLSPATIRNEMARLEEEGYIDHPHTSAGRVPANRGYRVYVESLMPKEDLPRETQETIRHQFHQAGRDAGEWAHLGATVLAQAAGNAAVVTVPRADECRYKHLELVGVHDNVALVVLVLSRARLRQQLVAFSRALTQEELSGVAARLNAALDGRSFDELDADDQSLPVEERLVYAAVREQMAAAAQAEYDEACLEGVRNVLMQPEFADTRRALELLEVLDEHTVTRVLPLSMLSDDGVAVFIGDENGAEELSGCSVIVARYGASGAVSGAMAVVGPTRMRYSRSISAVRYMTSLLSSLLDSYYQ